MFIFALLLFVSARFNWVFQKKFKKEKMRPILVNKEEVENIVDIIVDEVPPANHFEEIHPKDDFELLRSNSIPVSAFRKL